MSRWLLLALGIVGMTFFRRKAPGERRLASAPLDGELVVTPHGRFGAPRKGPPAHSHQGVDLAAKPGSFVRAIGAGTVIATNPGLGGLVRKLKLDMPTVFVPGREPISHVVYADLGSALRDPGDRVEQGEPIAVVGGRGFIHFATKRLDGARDEFFDPARAGLLYRSANERATS